MADAGFIEKAPVVEPCRDFALLRDHGIAWIEKLAHEVWTDYNVHDPGITLLELLCYAITDLGYRTAYPIGDLLTETDRGLPVNRANFHTARQVLTGGPVTFEDLRKILIDVEGVRNAWIEKHQDVQYRVKEVLQQLTDVKPGEPVRADDPSVVTVGGLYDVYIDYDDNVGGEPQAAAVGPKDKGEGGFVDPREGAAHFHAARPMMLDAVTVYPEEAGRVTIRLLDRTGRTLQETTAPVHKPGEAVRIPLSYAVPAGSDYRLDAAGTTVKLHQPGEVSTRPSIPDVIYLARPTATPAGVPRAPGENRSSVFYDWEVTFPTSRTTGTQARTTVYVGPPDASGSTPIESKDKAVAFDVLRDVRLESVDIYSADDGPVTIRLLDATGAAVAGESSAAERTVQVKGGTGALTVDLGFELHGGRSYQLQATDTKVRLARTPHAAFPYEAPNALRLTGGIPSAAALYFFYHWRVSYETPVARPLVARERVRTEIRNRLFAHRNLCEDVMHVCELRKQEIGLCADIEVVPGADLDAVLAEIFYRVECYVSPPVRFHTLQEMLAKGRTVGEIFEGPPLDHGFIDDEEFHRITRRCELRVSDIVDLLVQTDFPDLVAIRSISLLKFSDGNAVDRQPWILPLSSDSSQSPPSGRDSWKMAVPSFAPALSKIVFYKNDLPYYANRTKAMALYQKKRAANGRAKVAECEGDLPVPVGAYRDPGNYYPAQNDLPPAYCVGQVSVAESDTPLRKAQSKQLKAYLLFFEQILANYLSQLANVRTLFSWLDDKNGFHTYFTQPVKGILRVADLYLADGIREVLRSADGTLPAPPRDDAEKLTQLAAALQKIVETPEGARERRNRFLDHLLARFCEDLTQYSLLMRSLDDPANTIEDRRLMLEDYPDSSGERARAYNYRYPDWSKNLSGYQHRVYRLLGIRTLERRCLASPRIVIEDTPPPSGSGNGTQPSWSRFVVYDDRQNRVFESTACATKESIDTLLDFALSIGADKANWKTSADGTYAELLRRCPDPAKNDAIGKTTPCKPEALSRGLESLRVFFDGCGRSEGFHAIEHVLLRPRTAGGPETWLPIHLGDSADCPEVRDPYSFRLTVLLPSWSRRFRDLRFRRLVEETLRREAPAHVFVKICWISHDQMRQVEERYADFAGRLAALEPRLGLCPASAAGPSSRGGETPLPKAGAGDRAYAEALARLIEVLGRLVTVYPVARLHDCTDTGGDEPQISLNNTNLGTF